MKLSWLFVIALIVFVAVFSVQNADVMTVRFLGWEITLSAALVIQLAALLGGLVGLTAGAWSRRSSRKLDRLPPPTESDHEARSVFAPTPTNRPPR